MANTGMRIAKDSYADYSSQSSRDTIPATSVSASAVSFPVKGSLAYDTITDSIWYANGTSWLPVGGSNTNTTVMDNNALIKYPTQPEVDGVWYGSNSNSVANNAVDTIIGNLITREPGSTGSTAVGYLANVGTNCTAIGASSNANNNFCVAVGDSATALGDFAIAVNGSANGERAIAFGATALGNFTTAVNGPATGNFATTIGSGSVANGDGTSALGASTNATFNGASAIGFQCNASQFAALAVGNTSNASGDRSIAVGQEAKATNLRAIAIGSQSEANGDDSITIGGSPVTYQSIASGTGSIAMGTTTLSGADYSIAIGSRSRSLGIQSIAVGATDNSLTQTIATGPYAIAIGSTARADEQESIAIGRASVSSAPGTVVIGTSCTDAGFTRVIVLGENATATQTNQLALGINAQTTFPVTPSVFKLCVSVLVGGVPTLFYLPLYSN